MVTRALAAEDGNLLSRSLVSSRQKDYSDIDLTFSLRPNGDIYKKTDAASVKQAVKNLLLTNHYEKPFNMLFGGNLTALLFELVDEDSGFEIEQAVRQAIERNESRAKVVSVDTNLNPDRNSLGLTVTFRILNTGEIVSVNTIIARLR